jgi:hypothetical protein
MAADRHRRYPMERVEGIAGDFIKRCSPVERSSMVECGVEHGGRLTQYVAQTFAEVQTLHCGKLGAALSAPTI